jgi:hypothetical protein
MRTSHLMMLLLATGCAGTEEAATVSLPVTTMGSPMQPATTDLGYQVQVEQMRIAVVGIQFTIEGEMHAATPPPGTSLHPGHSAGGEVTGELPGSYVLAWNGAPQPALGDGTLLVGDYRGANFAFRGADGRDALAAADPLLGHAFHITGTVGKDGATKPFDAVLDVEPDAAVVGAVFEDVITEASDETLAIAFLPTDPTEGDTAFDGVDFFALPATPAGAIEIRPGSAAHNIIRRAVQTHDHYSVIPQ